MIPDCGAASGGATSAAAASTVATHQRPFQSGVKSLKIAFALGDFGLKMVRCVMHPVTGELVVHEHVVRVGFVDGEFRSRVQVGL